jgi:hypothetical protein
MLFISASTAIFAFSPPESYLAVDSAGYLEPAIRLVEEGVYSSEIRLPGYPSFLAAIMLFTKSIGATVVAIQSILLFAIAVMAALLAERTRPGSGIPALALICFNPSTLYYAQLALSDILFTFLFMIYFFSLIQTYREGSIYSAILVGIAAGLTATVRGNGQYLLLAIPIVLVFGYRLANTRWPEIRQIRIIFAAGVAALLVLGPLFYVNATESSKFSFVSDSYRNYVIHENVIKAVSLSKSISMEEAADVVHLSLIQREDIPVEEWESLDRSEQYEIVARDSRQIMADLGLKELTIAVSKALAAFFLTSEGRGWSQLLQQDTAERIRDADVYRFSLSAILQNDPSVSLLTKVLHFLTIAFYALIYLICPAGIFYLARIRAWDLLFSASVCVIIFAGTAGFLGYSRFRLPLEPLILILASIGLPAIMQRLKLCIVHRGAE